SSEKPGADGWSLSVGNTRFGAGPGYHGIVDFDEAAKRVTLEVSPGATTSSVCTLALDDLALERCGDVAHAVTAHFGKGHNVFVAAETALDAWPRWVARSVDGSLARDIPSVAETPSLTPWVDIERADDCNVAIVRPSTF